MRILFLCHRFSDTQIGGLSEFLYHLPKALKALNVESLIYTQDENKKTTLTRLLSLPNDIPCYTGPFLKPALFTNKNELKPLLILCKEQNVDLIHAQGIYRSGFMAMKACKKLNIPYICTSHSDILSASSKRIQRTKIQKRCARVLKNCQGATHLTPAMAKAANQFYNADLKSVVIGNGIDLSTWRFEKSFEEKNYVLSIGRLEKEKGVDILIQAMSHLLLSEHSTSLVIAGSGSEENNLKNQAKQLGLNVIDNYENEHDIPSNSIVFTGYVSGETKRRLFSHAKIILFSPQPLIWEEPFGIVQIESMAAGKLLIASDTMATRYLMEQGLHAKTVLAHDPQAWSQAIEDFLKDENLRKKWGEANFHNASRFDWSIIAKQYKDFYSRFINS